MSTETLVDSVSMCLTVLNTDNITMHTALLFSQASGSGCFTIIAVFFGCWKLLFPAKDQIMEPQSLGNELRANVSVVKSSD